MHSTPCRETLLEDDVENISGTLLLRWSLLDAAWPQEFSFPTGQGMVEPVDISQLENALQDPSRSTVDAVLGR